MLAPGSEMTTSVLIRHTGAWVKYGDHAAEVERLQRVERAWHFVQNCPQDEPLRNALQQAFSRDFKGGAHETKAPVSVQPGVKCSHFQRHETGYGFRDGWSTVGPHNCPWCEGERLRKALDAYQHAALDYWGRIEEAQKCLKTAFGGQVDEGGAHETKAPPASEALSSKERST